MKILKKPFQQIYNYLKTNVKENAKYRKIFSKILIKIGNIKIQEKNLT